VLPIAARQVIDHGFHGGTAAHVGRYFLGLLAVTIVMGLASASRYYLVTWIGERVVAEVRHRVFGHLLGMSPEFFERARTGELLSRLNTDTTLVQVVVSSSASLSLRSFVMAIGALVMMAVTSPKLTALALLGVPIVVGVVVLMGRRVRGLSRASQDRIAETSAYAAEVLNAMPTVQAYTHEPVDLEHYGDAIASAFATAIRRTRVRAALTAAVFILAGASIVGVLWIGASDVLAGRMSAGQLGQFVLYAVILASSVGALSELWGEVQRAAGATERLMPARGDCPSRCRGDWNSRASAFAIRPDRSTSRCTSSTSRCSPARSWRWSDLPAPASRPCFNCCCGVSIHRPAASCWTAATLPASTPPSCVRSSPSWRRSQ
jgi:ATP-binding cassette subfamily B protein